MKSNFVRHFPNFHLIELIWFNKLNFLLNNFWSVLRNAWKLSLIRYLLNVKRNFQIDSIDCEIFNKKKLQFIPEFSSFPMIKKSKHKKWGENGLRGRGNIKSIEISFYILWCQKASLFCVRESYTGIFWYYSLLDRILTRYLSRINARSDLSWILLLRPFPPDFT